MIAQKTITRQAGRIGIGCGVSYNEIVKINGVTLSIDITYSVGTDGTGTISAWNCSTLSWNQVFELLETDRPNERVIRETTYGTVPLSREDVYELFSTDRDELVNTACRILF